MASDQIIDLTSDDEEDAFAMRVDEKMGEKLKEPLHEIRTPAATANLVRKQSDITKWTVSSNAGIPARPAESANQKKPVVPPVPSLLDQDVSGARSEMKGEEDQDQDQDQDEDEDEDADGDQGCDDDEGDDDEGQMGYSEEDDELFSDIVEAVENNGDDRGSEKAQIIAFLREHGPHEFVDKYLDSDAYTPVELCAILGMPVEAFFEGRSESDRNDVAMALLGKFVERVLRSRLKLPEYNTIDDAAQLLSRSKRILVLTGAGISTSLGIPDFRSSDGLYAQLEAYGLAEGVSDPQDVFSLQVFRENPRIFYSIARNILSTDKRFSPTHAFIRLLQDHGKLQTNFTQNIDNLEASAGIHSDKLIHCHGSFATATCQKCYTTVNGDEIHDEIRAFKNLPRCKRCAREMSALQRPGIKRKRSSAGSIHSNGKAKRHSSKSRDWDDGGDTDEDDSIPEPGIMKPDIIFFGEDLPDHFHRRAMDDKLVVDLVIVIGTSLKVAPVSDIPNFIPPNVPQIYISRDPCKHINFDIELLGECDVICAELCKRAGWNLSHEMLPKGGYEVDINGHEGMPGRHNITALPHSD